MPPICQWRGLIFGRDMALCSGPQCLWPAEEICQPFPGQMDEDTPWAGNEHLWPPRNSEGCLATGCHHHKCPSRLQVHRNLSPLLLSIELTYLSQGLCAPSTSAAGQSSEVVFSPVTAALTNTPVETLCSWRGTEPLDQSARGRWIPINSNPNQRRK